MIALRAEIWPSGRPHRGHLAILAGTIRLPAPRRQARQRDHHRGRDAGAAADLERKASDGHQTQVAHQWRHAWAIAQGYRTDNPTRSFSSGLFFEAFAMLISLRQTQTAD